MKLSAIFLGCVLIMGGDFVGDLRDKVAPSVVAISIVRESDPAAEGVAAEIKTHVDYYRRPGGVVTGTIVESDGFILTSYFNVSGVLKKISVTTADGKKYEGKLVGYDCENDIALIKIEANNLPVLPRGASAGLRQGDFVAVVGRSPSPASATINTGIVSALGRMRGRAFQMDAELNYGNVGGPVVDADGNMVGIGAHIDNKAFWGQSSGVGFAAKIEEVSKILPRLKAGEKIEKPPKPYLGIMAAEDADVEGVKIMELVPGGPADKAGIKREDVILRIDGKKIVAPEDLVNALNAKKVGEKVSVTVQRGTETIVVTLELEESR